MVLCYFFWFFKEFGHGFSENFDEISDVTDRQINAKIHVERNKNEDPPPFNPSIPQPLDPSTPQLLNPQSLNPSSLNPSTPHLIDGARPVVAAGAVDPAVRLSQREALYGCSEERGVTSKAL